MDDTLGSRGRPFGLAQCCLSLLGTATGAVAPRKPDRAFLAGLTDAGLPTGTTTVTVRVLPQVSRRVPTAVVVEGRMRPPRLPNAMTGFVVEHPRARFLVDPGVCEQVRPRAIAQLPQPLRGVVDPGPDVVPTVRSLAQVGIGVETIDFALPTHLHWDHVTGLLDLPGLSTRVHGPELVWMQEGRLAPAGGVRDSLASRPLETFELDGPPVLSFTRSHDVFGDGSVVLVDLSGHTPGSVGVLLRTTAGPVLIAGDAAWHHRQVEEIRQKAAFPGLLVDSDREEAFRTLHRLHAVKDRVRVVPTHDPDAARALAASVRD